MVDEPEVEDGQVQNEALVEEAEVVVEQEENGILDSNHSEDSAEDSEVQDDASDVGGESEVSADTDVEVQGEESLVLETSNSGGETEYEDAQDGAKEHFSCAQVKVNDSLSYRIPETGDVEVVLVLSRAAKATGLKRHWWNVQVLATGDHKSVNMEAVFDLKRMSDVSDVVPTLVVSIPRYLHDQPECTEAKTEGIEKLD